MNPAAHPRLAARHRRILRIRRTVASAAVAVFLATFTTIYVQMAAGHDPVLAASKPKTAVATTPTTSTTSTDSSDDSASLPADTQTAPAPVTTRQS